MRASRMHTTTRARPVPYRNSQFARAFTFEFPLFTFRIVVVYSGTTRWRNDCFSQETVVKSVICAIIAYKSFRSEQKCLRMIRIIWMWQRINLIWQSWHFNLTILAKNRLNKFQTVINAAMDSVEYFRIYLLLVLILKITDSFCSNITRLNFLLFIFRYRKII